MSTEIVKIDPKEFGLEETKAADIAAQFQPMLDKMVELEKEYNDVIALPIEEPLTAKKAKELRLKYVKVRTGTAEIHKAQKAFYLAGGRYVDGWKNAQIFASQGIEDKLESIEKYQESLEKERIAKLQAERIELIAPFVVDTPGLALGTMPQDVFDAYYAAKKQAHLDFIEAERKAEEERIAKEKAEAEDRERIRIENERLKAEAEQMEVELKAEREKVEAERKAAEEKAAKELAQERARAEAERLRIEKENQARIDAERKEREKVEAELKAKKDAEQKAEAQRLAEEDRQRKEAEKMAKAPIKKQMKAWVSFIQLPEAPTSDVTAEIIQKFESFKKWAETLIDKM